MATGGESNEMTHTNANGPICPICLDQFKTPRILSCLHTFCEKCILSLISSNEASKSNQFECPACRRTATSPSDITAPSQWVKIFPVNHYVPTSVRTDEDACVGIDEDAQTKPCDPCLSKDIRSNAATFCKNCHEYLCGNCAQSHDMFKAFRSHKLLRTENIQKNPSHFLQEIRHSYCVRHSDKEIEYVCKSHDVLCCTKCVILDHRICKDVVELFDICSGIRESHEANQLQLKLVELTQQLGKIKELAYVKDMGVKKQSNDIIAEVQSVTKKAEDIIAAYKSSVLEQLHQIGLIESSTMSMVERKCLSLKAAIQGSVEILKTFMIYGTEQQIFITIRKLQNHIEDYKINAVELLSRIETTPELGLQVSSASNLLVQNNLGEMLQNVKIKVNVLKEVDLNLVPKEEGKENTRPISEFKKIKAVNFDAPGLREGIIPAYTGATFISGNRIVLVDSNNSRCLLYDSKFKQVAEKNCASAPFGVASINDNNIAVSLPHQAAIQIFAVQDTFIHLKTIKMRWDCWGVASLGNNELAVVCNIQITNEPGKSIITIIDLEGQLKKIIDTVDIFPNRQATISYDSKYIAVDKATSLIYCYLDYYHELTSEYKKYMNKCFSAIYEDKMIAFIGQASNCCYIGIDNDGNAYVNITSRGIDRISSTGKTIGILQVPPPTKTPPNRKWFHPTADSICFSSEEPKKFAFASSATIYVCELH